MKKNLTSSLLHAFLLLISFTLFNRCSVQESNAPAIDLKQGFLSPPDSARPGVYWYFMDGNFTKEGVTKDLESMAEVGIGQVVFLEVNVGIPRGKVDFLSEEWLGLFEHVVHEAERLGITITLGVGPGWTGSGGPWVEGSESMKHMVSSRMDISGDGTEKTISLPVPEPKNPYFGLEQFPEELKKRWSEYYEDIAVLAFPTPSGNSIIEDIDEKALYYREPYTSKPGVKQFLISRAEYPQLSANSVIPKENVLDITEYFQKDGSLKWIVPEGNWTIMRLGSRNNGAITRPAPLPGVGFEADKFDTSAINAHLQNFTGKIFARTGVPDKAKQGGLKMLHMDSWEMGSQNWTALFREEFTSRRGYDPMPFYPVYAGLVVESLEISERFLWDLRQTSTELIVENHALHLKNYARKYNMGFSIEPYDMNPSADMELGSVADVPMCEFWSKDYGFISGWSCIQAASIAHVNGNPVVAAEAFTAHLDAWKMYPGVMKNQGDWAFAAGVNRLVYHTYQHQCLDDKLKPGMTMGPYGVHHDRGQTWWPMAEGYHKYVTRCQFMLQQGKPVADILYLTPEGSPQVFRAPKSALTNDNTAQQTLQLGDNESITSALADDEIMPDRKGYNFAGCPPSRLYSAIVKNNKIVFPEGAEFKLLVLPKMETMTPAMLEKIESLIKAGAVVIGNPPKKSPGLSNYPECDKQVEEMAESIWGNLDTPAELTEINYGKGKIFLGGEFTVQGDYELYPTYEATAAVLKQMGITEDFISTGDLRYNHHTLGNLEFYFVSNKTNKTVQTDCRFRITKGKPELWDPLTGLTRELNSFSQLDNEMVIPMTFESYQSFFVVFDKTAKASETKSNDKANFPALTTLTEISGNWTVRFDTVMGGPATVNIEQLSDWSKSSDKGIKYYSGIAKYQTNFSLPDNFAAEKYESIHIDLGIVHNLARVKLNGEDLGVLWTSPWRIDISKSVKETNNTLEIEVANLWPNRLIGDAFMPWDGPKNFQWPEWLLKGEPRTSGRYTFSTFDFYTKDSPLLESGLLGPVKIMIAN